MQASSSSRSVSLIHKQLVPGRLIWAQPSCGLHRSYGRLHATAAAAEAPFSQHANGLSEIASNYEAVLLDQFGVLHDGKRTYSPATVTAVQHLAAAGLKVFIVSNSSRRSSGTIKKLQKLGFDASWFSGAVTSGDMAHLHLERRPTAWWQSLGLRCIHFTWSTRGNISLDGLGLQVRRLEPCMSAGSVLCSPYSWENMSSSVKQGRTAFSLTAGYNGSPGSRLHPRPRH